MLVAQQIVADIQRLGYTDGDRLPPERIMLEQYSIGRGTLRESLRYLELQGVIALKSGPGGGPVLQTPDSTGLESSITLLMQMTKAPYRTIIEARQGLEPVMARLAAERISAEKLEAIKQNLVEMEREGLDSEPRFLELNKDFHSIIAHSSGNELFGHLLEALMEMIDGSAVGIAYTERTRSGSLKAHQAIYDALVLRDPEKATAMMARHIEEFARYAESHFSSALDSSVAWASR
jgi:DNA-binding FadR family transcriptional regulator